MLTLIQAVFLLTVKGLPAQAGWHQIGVDIERVAGNWVVKTDHNGRWATRCWGPHEVFHDAHSHSLVFFGGDFEINVVSEQGVRVGVIPVGNVGMTRTCFVSNGLMVFDVGARAVGKWHPGRQILNWMLQARTVLCVDLANRKIRWKDAELKMGYPVGLFGSSLVSIGVDNYRNVFQAKVPPRLSARLIDATSGRRSVKYRLRMSKPATDYMLMETMLSTQTYRPTVSIGINQKLKLSHLVDPTFGRVSGLSGIIFSLP